MKFGTQLSNALHPEWKFYYTDYDNLKRLLKVKGGEFNESHEAVFIEAIESELDKVATFCTIKSDELTRRVQHCEGSVDDILKAAQVDDIAPERFDRVEDEMSRITSEVAELAKFIRVFGCSFARL